MLTRRRRTRTEDDELPPVVDTIWLGGRYPFPDIVTAAGEAVPDIMMWLDLDGERLVQVITPSPEFVDPFAFSLALATLQPGAGYPRRPRRIRVGDTALAQQLAEVQLGSEITVAPTPELDAAFEELCAAMRGEMDDACSYFEDGAIGEPVVAELFAATAQLYRATPWNELAEFHVLEIDIKAFGIEGACLCVTGAPDVVDEPEVKGLMLFRSFEDHNQYMAAIEAMDHSDTLLDFHAPVLALTYQRREELPQQMRRETASQGWPVAAASAYPLAEYRNRYGVPEALREHDVRVLAACARGLVAFLHEHHEALPYDTEQVIEGTYSPGDGIEIRLAAHGSDWMLDPPVPQSPVVHGPKVGRNEPCPCGSGKKYKKCCLPRDEAARRGGAD